ncbi:tyrosine-type recombinase/integrase [Sphingomonas aracearum]|uniref:DUF4102 domain-containing protein n=1 Tax=Sphingomonas aracearum TaxID=2283317 RepID=A0A369W392_9SPHN|nr:Arm DNA-binding domain-containing protein [Sphingomonas aracearum]RDE06531.1 DUF4102 domain-containing protein [Sphingomonas aracearum]
MPLTAAEVRNAKPGDQPYKLADGGGLYLFVARSGARSWRLKYRFGGKEKLLTFGLYPEVSLAEARDRRDEARTVLRQDKDPAIERALARRKAVTAAANTFEAVAREWHAAERPRWSPGQAQLVLHVPAGAELGPVWLFDRHADAGGQQLERAVMLGRLILAAAALWSAVLPCAASAQAIVTRPAVLRANPPGLRVFAAIAALPDIAPVQNWRFRPYGLRPSRRFAPS